MPRSPSARALSNVVDLFRFGGTQDPDGGMIAAYTSIAASVPCSVQPDDPIRFFDETTSRIIEKTTYTVFFAANFSLKANDKIVWVDDANATRILFVFGTANEAGKGGAFSVSCEERL